MKTKKLIIFGTQDYAEIVYEYFTHDSDFEVVAFTVDREYMKKSVFCGLSVIPWDEIHNHFLPEDHYFHAAVVYGNLNRDRASVCARAKKSGYRLASYISSKAFIWHNVELGEHHFIFEGNVLQPLFKIGNNVIMWSSNHGGHSSTISNNVFISSHVVISGHCEIGSNCFIGVNSTLANGTTIGKESWVSHGSIMSGDIPPNSFVKPVTGNTETVPLNEEAMARALRRARK